MAAAAALKAFSLPQFRTLQDEDLACATLWVIHEKAAEG
jgi:hypothetical protein